MAQDTVTELRRMARDIRQLGRQAQFAHVVALTRTALDVRAAEVHEVDDSFDRPTGFTRNAFYVKPATRALPEAAVGIKDDTSSGRGPVRWLQPEIEGGRRELKGFERAVRSLGVMNGTQYLVPGRAARLDAYGNVSRGQIIQILSQLRAFTGAETVSRNLVKRDGSKQADRKRRSAFRRAGGQYFVVNGRASGGLVPGIYQRQVLGARTHGASDRRPRAIFLFVDRVSYEQRFDFWGAAQYEAERSFPRRFDEAIAQHVRLGSA